MKKTNGTLLRQLKNKLSKQKKIYKRSEWLLSFLPETIIHGNDEYSYTYELLEIDINGASDDDICNEFAYDYSYEQGTIDLLFYRTAPIDIVVTSEKIEVGRAKIGDDRRTYYEYVDFFHMDDAAKLSILELICKQFTYTKKSVYVTPPGDEVEYYVIH